MCSNQTQDQNGRTVNANDMVEVKDGPAKDKIGTVKYIYHSTLFIYNREWLENAGFICVRGRSAAVRGSTSGTGLGGGVGAGGQMGNMTPFRGSFNVFAPTVLRSPAPHQQRTQSRVSAAPCSFLEVF